MVLDFAALTRRGQRLLRSRRADLELLRRALAEAGSPYAHVVAAVCAQLPRLGRRELGQVLTALGNRAARARRSASNRSRPPDYLAGTGAGAMNATAAQLFWWVALPYLALGVFVVGHVWRWRYDQFGWTSRSTQLQERRLLKWGGPLFHYGTFAAIAGHVIGILIPERVDQGDRHPRARLPLVLRRRGHARRRAGHRRGGGAREQAPARAAGPGHHAPVD